MPPLTSWLNELKKYGFDQDPNASSSLRRRVGFLEHSIYKVNLRLHPGKASIRLGVGYTDNFRRDSLSAIWIRAALRRSEAPRIDSPGDD